MSNIELLYLGRRIGKYNVYLKEFSRHKYFNFISYCPVVIPNCNELIIDEITGRIITVINPSDYGILEKKFAFDIVDSLVYFSKREELKC